MSYSRRIPYRLRFRIPVGVHTGLGVAGLIDRSVVRGAHKLPQIPGSTVKGRLRFFTERLLRAGGAPEGYSVHPAGGPYCKLPGSECTLCRLFGNPALAGRVRFGLARPEGEWADRIRDLIAVSSNPVLHPDADVRPGIALSRRRRIALADHLFFDETVPALPFAGELLAGPEVGETDLELLRLAGRLVDSLGSRKAVGRGALEAGIELPEAPA